MFSYRILNPVNLKQKLKFCFCVEKKPQRKFIGVYADKQTSGYRGQIVHQQKIYYCGSFATELEAAQGVNAKCVELDIPLKNPEIEVTERDVEVSSVLIFGTLLF